MRASNVITSTERAVACTLLILLPCMAALIINPAKANAQQLEMNSSQDVVFRGDQECAFTINAPTKGYFYFQFTMINSTKITTGEEISSTAAYKITSNYKDYETNYQISSGSGVKESYKYCFKPGRKVTVKLYSPYKNSNCSNTVRVTVKWKKPSNFESEPNGSKKSASKLELRKTYTGIRNEGDTDWWCFKASKTKKYKFRVACAEGSTGVGVSIYKGATRLSTASGVSVGGGWLKTSCKLKKGQKVYFKLAGTSSFFYQQFTSVYKVKVL